MERFMKKVLFMDYGQVMVRYNPYELTAHFVSDEDDRLLVSEILFDRLYWDRLDAGTLEDEEFISEVKKRLPMRLWNAAESIYESWAVSLPEISGMRELVLNIKKDFGVSACLISNISKNFARREGEIDLLKIFENKVYSAVSGFVKPSYEIFDYACRVCGVLPSEAVFVDDSEKNIKGGENFGIDSVLFDGDSAKLYKELRKIFSKN